MVKLNVSSRAVAAAVAFAIAVILVGSGTGIEAHPCGHSFFSALVQLVPCKPSVSPFKTVPPSEPCCAAIKTLGQPCLCVLANGPPISGVDRNLALQLPGKCNVNFPPCEMIK